MVRPSSNPREKGGGRSDHLSLAWWWSFLGLQTLSENGHSLSFSQLESDQPPVSANSMAGRVGSRGL